MHGFWNSARGTQCDNERNIMEGRSSKSEPLQKGLPDSSTWEFQQQDIDIRRAGHDIFLTDTLGVGGYGVVYKAKETNGSIVAVKEQKKVQFGGNYEGMLQQEQGIFQKLNHKHIIKLLACVQTPIKLYYIMEFAAEGDLDQYQEKNGAVAEAESRRMFRQIISAVRYMHLHKIAHRDLKCANVLLDDQLNCKLADFSCTIEISETLELRRTLVCTKEYRPPEVFKTPRIYDAFSVDMWSLGIILFVMLNNRHPFNRKLDEDLFLEHIVGNKYIFDKEVSDHCADLVSKLLIVNPIERISAPECMFHPWMLHRSHRDVVKYRVECHNAADEKQYLVPERIYAKATSVEKEHIMISERIFDVSETKANNGNGIQKLSKQVSTLSQNAPASLASLFRPPETSTFLLKHSESPTLASMENPAPASNQSDADWDWTYSSSTSDYQPEASITVFPLDPDLSDQSRKSNYGGVEIDNTCDISKAQTPESHQGSSPLDAGQASFSVLTEDKSSATPETIISTITGPSNTKTDGIPTNKAKTTDEKCT